jgi:hypothetical protein
MRSVHVCHSVAFRDLRAAHCWVAGELSRGSRRFLRSRTFDLVDGRSRIKDARRRPPTIFMFIQMDLSKLSPGQPEEVDINEILYRPTAQPF